jgi:hypothetical protein
MVERNIAYQVWRQREIDKSMVISRITHCCVGSSWAFGGTTVPAKCVSVMLLFDLFKVFTLHKACGPICFFQKCSGFCQILFKSDNAVRLGQWIFFGIPTGYSGRQNPKKKSDFKRNIYFFKY